MAGIKGMGSPAQIGTPVEQDQTDIVLNQANNKAAGRLPASASVTPAPGPNPSSLDDIFGPAQAASQAPAPSPAPSVPPSPAGQSLDDIFGAVSGTPENPETGSTLLEDIKNAPARAKASFGVTQSEKLASLKQSFGDDNVRPYGKDNFLIKGPDGKWKKFNNDQADILSPSTWKNADVLNTVLNNTRNIMEGSIAGATTAAGIAAGAGEVASGVGVAAAPLTIGAARALGGAAGTEAGNYVQAALGIPRDVNRSHLNEDVAAAGANVLFSGLGDFVANKLAKREAAKAAEAVASKTAIASQATQDVVDASNHLKQAGLIQNIPGTDTAVTAEQAAGNNPNLKAVAKQVSASPQYQSFIAQQGKMISDAFGKIANAVSDFTGQEKPYVNEDFQKAVESASDASGKLIGDYRQGLLSRGPEQVTLPKTTAAIQQAADDLGYARNQNVYTGDTLTKPKAQDLLNQGYTKQGARMVTNFVEPLMEKLYNNDGKLAPAELDSAYNSVQKMISNLENGTDQFGGKLFKDNAAARQLLSLRTALASDYKTAIGSNLSGQAGQDYAQQLTKYSQIQNASDTLKKVLATDPISSQAFSSYLFSKGTASLPRIQAAQTLLQDNPELWDQLKGNYLSKLINDNNGDYSKALGQLKGLGPEVLNQIFGDQTQNVLNLGKYADAVAKSPAASATPQKLAWFKDLALGVVSMVHGFVGHPGANAALNVIRGLDTQGKIAEFLSNQGVEKALGNVPPAQKPLATKLFNQYMDYVRQNAAAKIGHAALTSTIPSAARQAAARGTAAPNETPPPMGF